jgi:hypothetical protein
MLRFASQTPLVTPSAIPVLCEQPGDSVRTVFSQPLITLRKAGLDA